MDPAIVDSSQFGQLWKVPFHSQEQFYAKPLTYTPLAGGNQLLFLASSQNYIYTLDAKLGTLINSRQVHTPFLQSDIGCTDIPNYIGIIGTPTIDPATDIAYFFSKTYISNYRYAGNTGTFNGVYYFHGVNINTLEDVDGFPILIDGLPADNDPAKIFIGGTILQRPSLTQIGNMVYGGFGGHCDLFNYTGLVVGIDVTQKKATTSFSMMAGPLAPQGNDWEVNGSGGQAGIWMSGMSLSSDGQRIFMVTGNGAAHQNQGTPASGTVLCQTLGEACVDLAILDGGKLAFSDYFQPYDYQNMDGGDQDFGSGGISLLDPTVFKGTGVARIGVTSGKNGKIYILNADNLGGYRLGSGGTDGIIQTITTNKAVFGGAGSYPGEGGFIYSTPVGYPTYAYKLGFTSSGVPSFALAGQTNEVSAGRVGVGIPTITSLDGKAGTAILWMTDPDAGLRAWYAVPDQTGVLKSIKMPQVNGINKFQRPGFGNTRLYVTDANGVLYCLGSPVNLPLNCTSPVDFGKVSLGTKAYSSINCTALIAITSLDGMTVGDSRFEVSNSSLPQGPLKAGATFSIPVAWNLTTANVQNAPGASYGNTSPGVKSTALTIYTTNAVNGYSTLFPISLTGTEVSDKAFLTTAPTTVDFGGIVLSGDGDDDDGNTVTSSLVLQNQGLSPLTITGYGYTLDELDDDDVDFDNTTFTDGVADMGFGFSSSNLPAVGSTIGAGQSISVDVVFTPVNGTGNYASFFEIWSTGGDTNTILEGSASTAPIANFSISNGEGGWLPPSNLEMDFGTVQPGSTSSRQIRICNVGGSELKISKSKPPLGAIHVQTYGVDLHEEQTIDVGACAYGTVLFVAPTTDLNTPPETYTNEWTLNTDDLTFGVHVVEMKGVVVSKQVGPTNSTGLSVYEYLGCYQDNVAGRILPHQAYVSQQNTNGMCMEACLEGGYTFAGTEYQSECYCGNVPPSPSYLDQSNSMCVFSCAGDASEPCGGPDNGGYIDIFFDPTKYSPGDNYTYVGPSAPATVGNFNYLGCYSEATNGRALSDKAPPVPANGGTLDACAAGCQGYEYFGSEFGGECYCGNTINTGSALVPGDRTTNGCNMICNGNQSEYCGGANRLEMYQLNGTLPPPPPTQPTGGPIAVQSAGNWAYQGCYTEGTNGRALNGLLNPIPGAQVSVENCTTACQGYAYAGMEYSQECYCGNSLGAGSVLATGGSDPNANGCSMTCGANATEYCGGANRLSLYKTNNTAASSSISNTNPTPTPTGGPVTVQKAGVWTYYGCVSEATNGRALSALQNPIPAQSNSVENCTSACSGYAYAGMEYSGECYCGNTINGGAIVAGTTPDQTGCSMTCTGNATEYCGGPNRLNVYSTNVTLPTTTSNAPAGPTTGPVTVGNFAGWQYLGCYSEGTNQRALQGNYLGGNTVSIDSCAKFCSGYAYFGAEYSGECYCGNTIADGSALVAGTTPAQTQCNMVCNANATQYCGGPNRLNMYKVAALNQVLIANVSAPANSSTTGATSMPASSGISTALTTNSTTTSVSSTGISTAVSTNSTTSISSTATSTSSTSKSGTSITSTSSSASSTITSTATKSNSTSSTSTSTTSSSTFYPTPSQAIGSFTYTGCANDSSAARALTAAMFRNSSGMTTESCMSYCSSGTNNYRYAGTEFGTECYCGDILENFSTTGQKTCTKACAGNSTEICGGASALSVYRNSKFTTAGNPATVGQYVSYGCFSDSTNARSLSSATYTSDTAMTVESCVSFCQKKNSKYVYAGVEYGSQCFCGDSLATTAKNTTISSCNKMCTGNTTEFCGQASMLNVYFNDVTNKTQPAVWKVPDN
ncbi:MAG: hypothetical protein Q9227_002243 [Pyrenula ochraceoflavens]